MFNYVLQVALVMFLTFFNALARKPPGYIAPPKEYDPNPPKYEYGYRIQEDKVTHGKDERRDGIYAQGRYYVENGTQSSQNIKYFADDWGYHPVVEYGHVGPHSRTSTNFVLGEEAIKLKNNQKFIPEDPSDPGKAANLAQAVPSSEERNKDLQQPSPWLQDTNLPTRSFFDNSLVELPGLSDPKLSFTVLPSAPELELQSRHLQIEPHPEEPKKNQPIFYYIQPTVPPSGREHLAEALPQPQPLVLNSDSNSLPQPVETAALHQKPNTPIVYHHDFGTRLSPKRPISHNKLVESTQDLVNGVDVLNINAAADDNGIESSTLHDLLHKYVSPSIVTSTPASPTTTADLLSKPIVVADSDLKEASKSDCDEEEPQDQQHEIYVTPRPVSSKFLAPITAGIQLQQIEEQQSEDSKTVTERQPSIDVEVQQTLPHYLGMYEYPLEYDLENHNGSSAAEQAGRDIELGKTLLYFPPSGQEAKSPESQAIPEEATDKPVSIERSVSYQSHLQLPQKPAASQGAYLLQIPGLFSKQKYSSLVQNYQSSGLDYTFLKAQPITGLSSYAPLNTQYLPIYQASNRPQKLRKLNLLVLPRANVANLPPITRNPNDLFQNARYSKAKLNNGYLPPLRSNDHQVAGSSKNEQYVGLVPPKRAPFGQRVKQRTARAHFDEKSVRMEYGFKPPLIPSIEIDEYGRPIERDENKY